MAWAPSHLLPPCLLQTQSQCPSGVPWCPLPLSGASMAVHSLDSRGHHRAVCPLAGGLASSRILFGDCRVCREAGARSLSLKVRCSRSGFASSGADNRWIQINVDGMPLFQTAQLVVETTMVSAIAVLWRPPPAERRRGRGCVDAGPTEDRVDLPRAVKNTIALRRAGRGWRAD